MREFKRSKIDESSILFAKHMIFTALLDFKKKYGKKYGDFLFAVDGDNYWRKSAFPYYKCRRKAAKEKSDYDWEYIHRAIDETLKDLIEFFPYKSVEVEGAEGDDVIGVMCKWLQDNELRQNGLMIEPQQILILSSDQDHVQCQKYRGVDQWSPSQQKFVKTDSSIHEFLIEHIVYGDSGDGIPNILNPDDCFSTYTRQKAFKKARLPKFIELGIDACETDEERLNYERNRMLVDYDYIPQEISDKIISTYINQTHSKSKHKLLNYFLTNKMRGLVEYHTDF